MRRKKPPIELEILEKNQSEWFARVRLKTTAVEMHGYAVSPGEVDALLSALRRASIGRLRDIGTRVIGGWRVWGGVDPEWGEWVRLGWTLQDDPRAAWKFTASLYPKFFEARFFTPELGPFALSMALRPVMAEVKHVEASPYHPPREPAPPTPLEEYERAFERLKREWGWA